MFWDCNGGMRGFREVWGNWGGSRRYLGIPWGCNGGFGVQRCLRGLMVNGGGGMSRRCFGVWIDVGH